MPAKGTGAPGRRLSEPLVQRSGVGLQPPPGRVRGECEIHAARRRGRFSSIMRASAHRLVPQLDGSRHQRPSRARLRVQPVRGYGASLLDRGGRDRRASCPIRAAALRGRDARRAPRTRVDRICAGRGGRPRSRCSLERVVRTAVNAPIAGPVAGRSRFVAPDVESDAIESRASLRHARVVDVDHVREMRTSRSREGAGEPRIVGQIGPI